MTFQKFQNLREICRFHIDHDAPSLPADIEVTNVIIGAECNEGANCCKKMVSNVIRVTNVIQNVIRITSVLSHLSQMQPSNSGGEERRPETRLRSRAIKSVTKALMLEGSVTTLINFVIARRVSLKIYDKHIRWQQL